MVTEPFDKLWPVDGLSGVERRTAHSLVEWSGAIVSTDNQYRYVLWRIWGQRLEGGLVAWVMLNPSTADELKPDPTIKKCVGYSRRWGKSGLVVVNLFALRATDPAELERSTAPVGLHNPHFVQTVLDDPQVTRIVVAWGNEGALDARDESFCVLNAHRELWCLKPPGKEALTRLGAPRHPVRLPYDSEACRLTWDGALALAE